MVYPDTPVRWRRLARAVGCALAVGLVMLLPGRSLAAQLETLDRGAIAVRGVDNAKTGNLTSSQAYIGWRLLATDPANISFNVYRSANGGTAAKLNAAPITSSTNYVDATANFAQTNAYTVVRVLGGVEQAVEPGAGATLAANAPARQYLSIPLTPPTPPEALPDGSTYTYAANDCSVGDVDGDGVYEIFLKWDPSNAQDNSNDGYTGAVFLDCYRLDGTRLWRLNLGRNVRAGAHYTQYMVYDFDGDGKAELMCRTAPNTRDAAGTYVGGADKWQNTNGARPSFDPATADYRNSSGYVLSGPEFLTVFDGLTGVELASASYYPKRDQDNNNESPTPARINTVWGDSYGNRIDRFLAGVAYVDGARPSAIFCRGYYTRTYLAAFDWRGGVLTRRWVFDSSTYGGGVYTGNGDHSLSVADVDGDGKQEIIYGAMVIDDNGQILHNTTLGHGDALHVGDLDPGRPGLEIFTIQERVDNQGAHFRNALTGEVYWAKPTAAGSDEGPGRAMAADIDPDNPGAECWVAGGGISGIFSAATGQVLNITTSGGNNFSCNFRIYWDDDLYEELVDSNRVQKLNYSVSPKRWDRLQNNTEVASNNGTKSTPGVTADLFGDWREEIVWRQNDNLALRIYTTTIPTTYRFVTFMHDLQYRVAVAWQNTAYNQPPHPSFNPVFAVTTPLFDSPVRVWNGAAGDATWDVGGANNWSAAGAPAVFAPGDAVLFTDAAANTTVALSGNLAPAELTVLASKNYTFDGPGNLTGNMVFVKSGTGLLTVLKGGNYTGGTNIVSGTLALGANSTATENPANLGPGPIRIANAELRLGGSSVAGAAFDLPQNIILDVEGVVRGVSSRQNLNGNLTVVGGGGGTLTTSTSGQHLYVNGVLSGTGPLTASGTGTGAIHFTNGNNTYTGNLSTTSVSVDHATALKTARVLITGAPVFNVAAPEFGSIEGNTTFSLPSGALTVGSNNLSTRYTGSLTGAGGLVKTGTGNFTLAGNNTTSTFTGPVTINQGTLTAIHAATTTYTGNVTTNGTTVTGLSGTGNIVVGQFVTGTGVPANTTVAGLNAANATVTLSAALTANATAASYTFRSSRGVGNTTNVTVNGGMLNFGASNATVNGPVTLLNGTLSGTGLLSSAAVVAVNGTLSANLGGSASLTKNGPATVTLSGNNAYSGATTVNSGTLSITNNNSIPSLSAVTVAPGAVLAVTNRTMTFASLAGGGNVTLGNGTLTAGGSGASTTFAGNISGTGGSFTKAGAGTMILAGANAYTGLTTVAAGKLQIGDGGAAGTPGPGNITNNGALSFNRSTDLTYGGAISGSGSFEKAGPNTLTLTGVHAFAGPTTVAAGTLVLAGSISNNSTSEVKSGATLLLTGNFTLHTLYVRAGGKLTGTGTITGNVIIEGSGLLEGGTGPGTGLAVHGSLENSGTIRLTNGTGLTVSDTLTNAATGVLDTLTGLAPTAGTFVNEGAVVDAGAVRVGGIESGGGAIQLSIQSYPGHDYQLQSAASLASPAWQNEGPAQAGTGGVLNFTDPTGPTAGRKFYRIVVSP